MLDTTYHILPTAHIEKDLLLALESLEEYEIDLDYVVSYLDVVADTIRSSQGYFTEDDFSNRLIPFVYDELIENPKLTLLTDGELDALNAVAELVCIMLDQLCQSALPILVQMVGLKRTGRLSFNFIKWCGGDIMIVSTHSGIWR